METCTCTTSAMYSVRIRTHACKLRFRCLAFEAASNRLKYMNCSFVSSDCSRRRICASYLASFRCASSSFRLAVPAIDGTACTSTCTRIYPYNRVVHMKSYNTSRTLHENLVYLKFTLHTVHKFSVIDENTYTILKLMCINY